MLFNKTRFLFIKIPAFNVFLPNVSNILFLFDSTHPTRESITWESIIGKDRKRGGRGQNLLDWRTIQKRRDCLSSLIINWILLSDYTLNLSYHLIDLNWTSYHLIDYKLNISYLLIDHILNLSYLLIDHKLNLSYLLIQ